MRLMTMQRKMTLLVALSLSLSDILLNVKVALLQQKAL
nr:MAG TPA: hypothetical protein [Bacteriophage sp.]